MRAINQSWVRSLSAVGLLVLLFFIGAPVHAARRSYKIGAAPSSFSFAATVGGAAPPLQTIVFVSTPATALPFTLAADHPWITMSAGSGTTKATLQFGVNPAGLAAGSYSGHVLATPSGAGNSRLSIPVTLVVSASTAVAPAISTQPLSQTVTAGQTASFNVAATGTVPLNFQWFKNGAAISGATASNYTTPATASADTGTAFAVTVTNTASSATSRVATLTVNPAAAGAFVISTQGPSALSFAFTLGGTVPASQTTAAIATPPTPLPVAISTDQSWITVTGDSSNTKDDLTVSFNPAGLTAGVHTGNVIVTNTDKTATNSPFKIPVTLTVSASTAILTANTTRMAFGDVNLGSNSVLISTLTNSGTANIAVSNVTLAGPGFTTSGVSTGLILTPGQTGTLTVTFAPAGTGSIAGTVTVASNASNSPVAIALSGTGIQAVQHSVNLTWTGSTTSVIGYNVYRAVTSGGPYSKMNSSLNTLLSDTDTSVQGGQTYYYVVTSVDSTNTESINSNEATAVIP